MKAPRNGHAFATIMRKGGAHQKSGGAIRKNNKQEIAKELKMFK